MRKIIIILILAGLCYFIYDTFFAKNWQLSLYGGGATMMRLDYSSKDECLSAGRSYYRDGTTQYERFDCGYKCRYLENRNDLTEPPICSQVCDTYGCR